MEQNIDNLWTYSHTILATCSGGFFFLALWLRGLHKKVDESIVLEKSLTKMSVSLANIEKALLGSYENPRGLVHKHDDLEYKTTSIEKRLEIIEQAVKK